MPTRTVSWEDKVYVDIIDRLEKEEDKNFSDIVNNAVKKGLNQNE